jgi:FkbM family methyltransferase
VTPVIAVEAYPPTAEALAALATDLDWTNDVFLLFNYAMGDRKDGVAPIFSNGKAGYTQSSLFRGATNVKGAESVDVPLMTVDRLIKLNKLQKRKAFFVKIDAEGYDPWVLLGAVHTLRRQGIEWLLFEYNGKWAAAVHQKKAFLNYRGPPSTVDGSEGTPLPVRLSWVVDWLHDAVGYECFLLTSKTAVPLYGPWADERYDLKQWTNVMCTYRGNPHIFDFLNSYSKEHQLPAAPHDLCIDPDVETK